MNSIDGGLWPALLTPTGDDARPQLDELARLVEALAADGADGLYILGSTGQGPAFGLEDRKRVATRVLEARPAGLPVVVHVGAIATEDSVELARHAESIGADGISSVPPIYFPAGMDATFDHYRRISSSTGLPFFPYHLGSLFGTAALVEPSYIERLLALPNVAGMKVTVRDLYVFGLIAQRAGDRLTLFSGADELLCQAALSRAPGAIGTFYNIWCGVCERVRRSFVAGDVDLGRRFMATFQSVIDTVLSSGGTHAFLRAAVRRRFDVDIGPGRTPGCRVGSTWDDGDVEAVIEDVVRLDPGEGGG